MIVSYSWASIEKLDLHRRMTVCERSTRESPDMPLAGRLLLPELADGGRPILNWSGRGVPFSLTRRWGVVNRYPFRSRSKGSSALIQEFF